MASIVLVPTHETGVIGNMGLRYNIQMARASDGVWFQRHLWHQDQLGEYEPPLIGDWIVGVQSGPNEGMREVPTDKGTPHG